MASTLRPVKHAIVYTFITGEAAQVRRIFNVRDGSVTWEQRTVREITDELQYEFKGEEWQELDGTEAAQLEDEYRIFQSSVAKYDENAGKY